MDIHTQRTHAAAQTKASEYTREGEEEEDAHTNIETRKRRNKNEGEERS